MPSLPGDVDPWATPPGNAVRGNAVRYGHRIRPAPISAVEYATARLSSIAQHCRRRIPGAPVEAGGSGKSGVPRAQDRLRPVRYLELREHARDVVGDRLRADEQLPGDVRVAVTQRHQRQDLALAGRKLRERRRSRRRRPQLPEVVHEAASDLLAEHRLTAASRSYRPEDLFGPGPLEHVTAGPCAHRGKH